MSGSLTEAQSAAYARDGFLCPVPVFTPAETRRHRQAFEEAEARGRTAGLPRAVAQYTRVNAHVVMREAVEAATDPRILDAVESVLGPDLMLWSAEYIVKEPRSRGVVSWHQDLTYWGMDGSDHEVTAWVALSPASAEAGCMRFVLGSHRQAIVPHTDTFGPDNLLSRGQEIAVAVDEAEAVTAALEPGQMSLHHGRIFHASGRNTTDDRRIGLVLRFIRPDTPKAGRKRDYAMMVRGVDRHAHRHVLAPPAASFCAQALAVYEEVLADQQSVLAGGAEDRVAMYGNPA